jgi:hypothetical protein
MGKRPRKTIEQETIEQEDSLGLPKTAQDDITLSEFIQTMHEPNYSPVGSEKGLPTREWLKETFQTKSAAVRFLINQGFVVKDIAKHLNMRYQHVRNVSQTELKRGPNEDWRKPLLDPNATNLKSFKP